MELNYKPSFQVSISIKIEAKFTKLDGANLEVVKIFLKIISKIKTEMNLVQIHIRTNEIPQEALFVL